MQWHDPGMQYKTEEDRYSFSWCYWSI